MSVQHSQESASGSPGPAGTTLTMLVQGHGILFSPETYILGHGLLSIEPELPGRDVPCLPTHAPRAVSPLREAGLA